MATLKKYFKLYIDALHVPGFDFKIVLLLDRNLMSDNVINYALRKANKPFGIFHILLSLSTCTRFRYFDSE